MVSRLLVACLLSGALAFLLLLSSGSDVEATTFKVTYGVTLTCEGPDGVPLTGDDSCTCATGGAYDLDECPDMQTSYNIPATPWSPAEPDYANFARINTFHAPPEWGVGRWFDVPEGAYAGLLYAIATLSIANSPCTPAPNVAAPIPMYYCTTDNSAGNQIVWQGDGSNLTQDVNPVNGRPDGCDWYPRHVNTLMGGVINDGCPPSGPAESGGECENEDDDDGDTLVNDGCPQVGPSGESGGDCDEADTQADPALDHDGDGLRPRLRLYGFNYIVAGAPPTQINFVVLNPEQLTKLRGSTQSAGLPNSDMGDSLGYSNQVIMDNPMQPATPSAVTEFCTPLATNTTLWGTSGGEGVVIAPAGANPELGVACINWQGVNHIGVNDDPADDVVPDDGCWVVTDWCGDGVDNDGDTDTDEMCGYIQQRNPNDNVHGLTSGILDTPTHVIGAYNESQRDADGDGFSNNVDACPYIASATVDNTYGCDGCPPGSCTAGDQDGDGYYNRQDLCPFPPAGGSADQVDTDLDGIGAPCDNDPTTPDGPFVNDMPRGGICVAGTNIVGPDHHPAGDTDEDGWCDTTEDLAGHGETPISDKLVTASTPEWRVLDPLLRAAENPPGAAPGTCSNRDWYDTQRLGGPETDDDADGPANLLDPNCRGMNLDLTSPPSSTDPLELHCDDVIGSTWHELWPNYSNTYVATSFHDYDGNTQLDQGDQIDFDDGHWYHVDEVTVTIWVKEKPDLIVEKYLEWYASAEDMQDAIQNPETTQWHEIFPVWSQEYHLESVVSDTPPAGLSVSDQIILTNKDNPADTAEYHVEAVTIDIIVTQKPDDDPEDQDGVPLVDDNCPNVWNPEQLNIDRDANGDACDTEDDGDGMADATEWDCGWDPKDACSPFDNNGDYIVNVLDVLNYKPELGTPGSKPNFDNNCDGIVNVLDVLNYKPALGSGGTGQEYECPYQYG